MKLALIDGILSATSPRSGFLLRSPKRVSRKREFSNGYVETFRDFRRDWCEHRSPQRLLTHEKPTICGPFCLKIIIFSKRRTGWLTWEDSNFHITFSRNAFEMSTEFPLFWPRIRLGDFCNSKLKRWQGNTTRCPSQKPDQRFDVRACFEALYQLEGARAALLSTDVRVMLWNGRKDLAHDKMQGARRQGKAELFFRPRRPPWAIRYLEPR